MMPPPSLGFAPQIGLTPVPEHALEHRHVLDAVTAQTMYLLAQPLPDLAAEIQRALQENPALEVVEDTRPRCPRCGARLVQSQCPRCTMPATADPQEPIVFVSPRDDHWPLPARQATEEPFDATETLLAQRVDLATYVGRQVSLELREPVERRIAAFLLGNLDDDGLLTVGIAEAALRLRVSRAQVEAVLAVIQRADPLGVGSPSPRAALLAQAQALAEQRALPAAVLPLLTDAQGLDDWARGEGKALAKRLGMSLEAVTEAVDFIARNLNPYPGRAAWGDRRLGMAPPPPPPPAPDVVISLHNRDPHGPLVVEVISPVAGRLQVDPLFRHAVKQCTNGRRATLQEHLAQATVLVKGLRQRENTMVRLMQALARRQRAFILRGDAYHQPLTRATIAQELGVHESTISRAVRDKWVQLPSGKSIPLSRFFEPHLAVRAALRQLVAEEVEPLSDAALARQLRALGYRVARRTVAKYRAMEGIPPAYRRRNEAGPVWQSGAALKNPS